MKTRMLAIVSALSPAAAAAHDGHGYVDGTTMQFLHLLLDHGLVVVLVAAAMACAAYGITRLTRRRL
jgi:hypothetical protein